MTENPMTVAAATAFVVGDVAKSTGHHRDALGFSVTFQYGTPPLRDQREPEQAEV